MRFALYTRGDSLTNLIVLGVAKLVESGYVTSAEDTGSSFPLFDPKYLFFRCNTIIPSAEKDFANCK